MARQVDNNTFEKYQDSLKDFTMNWGDLWLNGDTISTSDWTVPAGLSEVSDSFDNYKATVWVSGGVTGRTYVLFNHIVTTAGKIDKRPLYLRIKSDDS